MFIVVPNKVHEIFVYQRKRSFSYLLLIMCGDVEKCPGLTGSNIQDLFKQKGLKVFHQYIRGLFHNIAKLSYFLHTHKHTHFLSVKRTSIIHHQHSFEIPGYTFIIKNTCWHSRWRCCLYKGL